MKDSKINKIKRLATDPAATNGERGAAVEALRRVGVNLDIEVATDPGEIQKEMVTMLPLAMITPTKECIYAPNRIESPVYVPKSKIGKPWRKFLVSFNPDGKSNPRRIAVYAVDSADGYFMREGDR